VAALLYIVAIAGILKLRLGRFFLKDFSLKGYDFYPIIIGGNNRLRFIDSSNSNALLIAKNSYSLLFTRNAMRAYNNANFSDLDLIPQVIPINDRVYLEKQINGLAINRIALTDVQHESVNNSLDSFFARQEDLSREISISTFLRYKKSILQNFSSEAKSEHISKLCKLFKSVSNKIEHSFCITKVSVSPSHGDLNRGNVFLDQDRVSIIDWEYFMYRYVKYDIILYRYDLRHQPLLDYVEFLKGKKHLDFNIILFLLEELFFRILNFKEDIADSQVYVDSIIELIYENLLIDRKR
jgi:3D (Asp-Asp-Asp) domain-containing protein